MIALDSSAIVAIALREEEEEVFNRLIAAQEAMVAVPSLVECHMVLRSRIPSGVVPFLKGLLLRPSIHPVAFTLQMYRAAATAFDRFGRGRHPAKLNFGDCLAYAVAKTHGVPLLYKGTDFNLTDIRTALA